MYLSSSTKSQPKGSLDLLEMEEVKYESPMDLISDLNSVLSLGEKGDI